MVDFGGEMREEKFSICFSDVSLVLNFLFQWREGGRGFFFLKFF